MKSYRGRSVWKVFLVVGVLAAFIHTFVLTGAPGSLLYAALNLAAIGAVVWGIRTHRPDKPAGWCLFALGLMCFLVGNLIFFITSWLHVSLGYPSVADAFYVLAYPLFFSGLLALLRKQTDGDRHVALFDSAVITGVLSIITWRLLISPTAHLAGTPLAHAAALAAPIGDLFLAALCLRLLMANGRRTAVAYLLLVGLLGELMSDVVYSWQQLHTGFSIGGAVDLGWLLFLACIGAAAIHPEMGSALVTASEPSARSRSIRLILVGLAAVLPIGVYSVVEIRQHDGDGFVTLLGNAVVILLAFGSLAFEKRLRSAVERERASLAAIVDETPDFVTMWDSSGNMLYMNRARRLALGLGDDDEVAGLSAGTLRPSPDNEVFLNEAIPAALTGGQWKGTTTVLGQEGNEISCSEVVIPLGAGGHGNQTVAAIARDMTEHLAMEAQLRQAQKMEAVGRLAGGIAHDLNNLLSVVGANAGFLAEDANDPEAHAEDVHEIRSAVDRASKLVKQLLTFSRREVVRPEVVDLNEIVTEVGRFLERLIGEDIELVTDLGDDLWRTKLDAGQVHQVITNLSVNARDAMPQGGRIFIATANSARPTLAAPDPGSTRFVHLSVVDDGSGMDQETQSKMFDPFFTTKPVGQGTGLGLATTHGIVEEAGGFIEVTSKIGVGTRFDIYFPACDELAEDCTEPSDVAPTGGKEVILLAEDEDSLRSVLARILKAGGYEVLSVSSAEEALRIVRDDGVHLDLLLTDIIMPGMNGKDLADEVVELDPELKIVFMSGYPGSTLIEKGFAPDQPFLQKPFEPEHLRREIARALGKDDRVGAAA